MTGSKESSTPSFVRALLKVSCNHHRSLQLDELVREKLPYHSRLSSPAEQHYLNLLSITSYKNNASKHPLGCPKVFQHKMLYRNFVERLTCSLLSQHAKYKLTSVSIIFACYFCLFIKHIIFSGYSNFHFLIYNAFFYLHCKRNVFLTFSMLKLNFSFFLSIFKICWTILCYIHIGQG